MGRVEAVCISEHKGERKTRVARATFAANHGIEGDAHAGAWHRQVSLLDAADIDEVRRNGVPDLQPGAFTKILLCRGDAGRRARLADSPGNECGALDHSDRQTCHAPCRIYHLTGDCMPRRGLAG